MALAIMELSPGAGIIVSPRLELELGAILFSLHPCPQRGHPQSPRSPHHVSEKQTDVVTQRLGQHPSSDVAYLCSFGLLFSHIFTGNKST